jgi:hypothetical protein
MNTSFGPRINYSKWDFHDGIDLPVSASPTPVYAVRSGVIHRAGPADMDYSSRHVILKVDDPSDGDLYVLYLHLDSIDPAIAPGVSVTQGQALGMAGADGATYRHLHLEFRKGTPNQISSVHPLGYLPYTNTLNFTAPVFDRANMKDTGRAARLAFGASSKREGDLKRVEVDLIGSGAVLATRVVDFNDKSTVNDAIGEEYLYVNDIGVEGYQTSNMVADGRTDLQYGILVRNLPSTCDTLVARVMDVRGGVTTSTPMGIPVAPALNLTVDFEDGNMPPSGWTAATTSSGMGTTVVNDPIAAHAGTRGLLATDASSTEISAQRAAIEVSIPAGRFEWKADAWVDPMTLILGTSQSVYPLYFLHGSSYVAAARVYNNAGTLLAGIAYKKKMGPPFGGVNSALVVDQNVWKKWTFSLLRIGTRETTGVLYIDGIEQVRASWDPGSKKEPSAFRAGIGLSSTGSRATLAVDDVQVAE